MKKEFQVSRIQKQYQSKALVGNGGMTFAVILRERQLGNASKHIAKLASKVLHFEVQTNDLNIISVIEIPEETSWEI